MPRITLTAEHVGMIDAGYDATAASVRDSVVEMLVAMGFDVDDQSGIEHQRVRTRFVFGKEVDPDEAWVKVTADMLRGMRDSPLASSPGSPVPSIGESQ